MVVWWPPIASVFSLPNVPLNPVQPGFYPQCAHWADGGGSHHEVLLQKSFRPVKLVALKPSVSASLPSRLRSPYLFTFFLIMDSSQVNYLGLWSLCSVPQTSGESPCQGSHPSRAADSHTDSSTPASPSACGSVGSSRICPPLPPLACHV